jgi:hypothetical protein
MTRKWDGVLTRVKIYRPFSPFINNVADNIKNTKWL